MVSVLFAGACGGETAPTAKSDSNAKAEQDDESGGQNNMAVKFKHLSPKECSRTRSATGATIPITVVDGDFKPECTSQVPKGNIEVVLLDKSEFASHNFTVPDQDVVAKVHERTKAKLKMTGNPIYFVCTFHPDQMYGALFPR